MNQQSDAVACPMIEHLCESCLMKHLATHGIHISRCHTRTRKGYTGRGGLDAGHADPTNGNPPVPAAAPNSSWAMEVATDVWLYASTGDGALYLYNDTAGTLKTPILSIIATAPTGLRP